MIIPLLLSSQIVKKLLLLFIGFVFINSYDTLERLIFIILVQNELSVSKYVHRVPWSLEIRLETHDTPVTQLESIKDGNRFMVNLLSR